MDYVHKIKNFILKRDLWDYTFAMSIALLSFGIISGVSSLCKHLSSDSNRQKPNKVEQIIEKTQITSQTLQMQYPIGELRRNHWELYN